MFSAIRSGVLLLLAFVVPATITSVSGQGLGGVHSIRGSIFLPDGRVLERPIKVELQSTTHPTQTDYTDANGAFAFTSLTPGTYTVVVDAGELFEVAREYFQIDKEVQSRSFRLPQSPKNLRAPIYLMPKRGETLRNEVLNAKWSAIPRDAIQHFKRGLDLVRAGKENEGEAEFRKSITIAPNFAPVHTAIGNLELKAGKLQPAVESFKQAIRYDAADFDANLNLGIAYLNLRKLDDAEPPLVTAAYIDRFAVTPHYYLGLVFSAKNDGDVAQKAFEKVKELNGGKKLPSIHKYLGRIYMRKQMNKEAVNEFETYLSLVPAAKDAEAIKKDIADIKIRPSNAN
jgi:tetratricopeptide (TPR) repeat protein